jgi:hypothetical protein
MAPEAGPSLSLAVQLSTAKGRTAYTSIALGIAAAFHCESSRCENDSQRQNVCQSYRVANMPQLCAAAYGCLEGIRLPTLGHCCLSSIVYIGDSRYLDIISNNAVIINVHLCSHSQHTGIRFSAYLSSQM